MNKNEKKNKNSLKHFSIVFQEVSELGTEEKNSPVKEVQPRRPNHEVRIQEVEELKLRQRTEPELQQVSKLQAKPGLQQVSELQAKPGLQQVTELQVVNQGRQKGVDPHLNYCRLNY